MPRVLDDEDLAAFLHEDDFADEVILPGGGKVWGLFDEEPTEVRPGTTVPIGSGRPTLTLTPADARDLQARDRLSILGRDFEVSTDRDYDPSGLVVLELYEV